MPVGIEHDVARNPPCTSILDEALQASEKRAAHLTSFRCDRNHGEGITLQGLCSHIRHEVLGTEEKVVPKHKCAYSH